jgi:CheY-like chemotaxis protein
MITLSSSKIGMLSPQSGVRSNLARIAIVDDNREVCSLLSEMLEHFGWGKPIVMHDGQDIVDAIENRNLEPDIILMDYNLPRMNGIDASREISKKCPNIRIIMITSDESIRSKAALQGLEFLKKPFSFKALSQSLFR